MAINVTALGDYISLDLVFGLNETVRNHIGLIVIVERTTRFLYVRPIKSKEAQEQVRILWEYISIFGPPKKILTDRGREFVNSLMEFFANGLGIEHITTSAYTPSMNGITERSNQTIIPYHQVNKYIVK
jgi:IS30 family transposase